MFNALTEKLQDSIQYLSGKSEISEANVAETIETIRKALLEADVSLKAVKLFINRVEKEAYGEKVLSGLNPGEQFVKIINDALVSILGGDPNTDHEQIEISKELNLELNPNGELSSIMLLGLQGSGKTTTSGKLAYRLKEQGKKVLLVPCDLQRPAAIEQLSILAKQAEVDFLELPEPKPKLLEVANLAQEYIKENGIDLVIYDTAGRLQIDTDLMAELLLFEKKVKPEHKLLVVDSLIGQEAANVAATFNTQIGIDAVVLSKLDSDARGGAALSIAEATSKPIKFAAVGEKLDDIENFHPSRIASRILGMGDVLTLVEQAQRKIEEEESKRLEAELMKGNFNFETFMSAQGMMSKLGDIGSLAKMMGMGGMLKQMGLSGSDQEDLFEKSSERMKKFKHAISSMTLVEKRNPKLLTGDASSSRRKARISQGSGLAKSEIDQLISEFNKMNQMFKTFGPMMKMFGGAGGGGGMPNPMAAMTGGGGAGGMNPMAALGNMMNPQQMAESMGLSKSQKRAMQSMGLGGGSPKMKSSKKFKKGQKPKIKGFNEN